MIVDTHAHLDSGQFQHDVADVIHRAIAAGVDTILTVGCDLQSSRTSIELASDYDQVFASVVLQHAAQTQLAV